MKHILFVLLLLGVATHADAGAVIELVPIDAGPYLPGQTVSTEVWLHNGDAVGHDLRLVALDVRTMRHRLFAGGDFTSSGDESIDYVAKLSAESWVSVGTGADGPVFALEVCKEGPLAGLYAGGKVLDEYYNGHAVVNRWNGYAWSQIGRSQSDRVLSLLCWNNGSGDRLYAGGYIWRMEDTLSMNTVQWDGSTWSSLRGLNSGVADMVVFDDGTGPALYAGGLFPGAISPPSFKRLNYVGRSDGWDWEPLGHGVMMDYDPWAVYALTVFDDGGGPALFVGGDFVYALQTPDDFLLVDNIAKWDGTTWSEVGGGVNPGMSGSIYDTIVFDDGDGPALYVGGRFTTAGDIVVSNISRWDGISWSNVGGGITGGENAAVRTMAVFDDGTGPALHVGGLFTDAGGIPVANIAKWNGVTWSAVGNGLDDTVHALTVVEDTGEPSPSLYPIFDFDFSTLSDNGQTYLPVPVMPYVGIIYLSMDPTPGSILHLPAAGSLRIGTLSLTLPATPGDYTVDVATPAGPGGGAQIQFGFGIDPGDPFTTWTSVSGGLTGGTYTFTVPRGSGQQIPTVSEWGMAAMILLVLTTGTLLFPHRWPSLSHR